MRYLTTFLLVILASCATIGTLNDVPQKDYVALGDSVTAGVGAGGTFPEIDRRATYSYKLAKMFHAKYANLAVPGAMADDLLRLQVLPAIGLRPRVVSLWIGGNDLVHGRPANDYGRDLDEALERLELAGAKMIMVLNLPDVWDAKRFRQKPDDDVTPERVQAYNDATYKAAKEHSAWLVDISGKALVADDMLADDGFHVGPKGHEYLLNKILEVMSKEPKSLEIVGYGSVEVGING